MSSSFYLFGLCLYAFYFLFYIFTYVNFLGKYRQIDGIFLKISRCQGDFVSLAVCSICYAEFIVLNYYNSGEFVELINAQNICFVHFQT